MQNGNSKRRRLNVEGGILEVRRGQRQLRSGPESLERQNGLGSSRIVQRRSRRISERKREVKDCGKRARA